MLRLCLTLGLFCTSVRAAEPLKDAEGVPLPDGATMRLGTTRLRLSSHDQNAGSLAVSHDGSRVACQEAGRVHVWEVETGKLLRQFDFPFRPARCESMAISPDGKQVVASSFDGLIQGWYIDTGETTFKRKISGDSFHWFGLGFRPDGTVLFTQSIASGNDRICILSEAKSGRNLHTFRGEDWSPTSADILPDGETFMGAQYLTSEGKIAVRSFDKKFEQKTACVIDPMEVPRNVGHSPNGSLLWVVHQNHQISFWNSTDGKRIAETESPPEYAVHDVPAGISWDGKQVAVSGYADGTIRLFDTTTGKCVKRFHGAQGGGHLAMSKDGKRLFHRGKNRVQIWDVATEKERHLDFRSHQGEPSAVAFDPRGREVASACGNEIRIWNPRTGEHLTRWDAPKENRAEIHSLSYSPDGKFLMSASSERLRVWDRSTGKIVHEWKEAPFAFGQFHPDGKRLIHLGPKEIEVRDLVTGNLLQSIPATPPLGKFALSRDGDRVALMHPEGVELLDLTKPKERFRLEAPETGSYLQPRFDPSGRYLCVVRLPDQVWTVYDLTSRLPRHGNSGADESFTPIRMADTSRMVAMTGPQPTGLGTELRLLDTATGRIRNRKTLPFSLVGTMSFSPDGRYLATGNSDTTLLIWDTWNMKGEFAVPDQVTEEMVREQWEHLGFDYVDNVDWMIQVMCKRPELTVSLLDQKLTPVAPVDAEKLMKLMNQLESERFVTRQRATAELTKLGEPVIDELRRRRETTTSEDLRIRIESILSQIDQPLLSGERLRVRRAMEILQRIKSPEAKELLQKLAKGDPEAMLTREAKAVLMSGIGNRESRIGNPKDEK